MCLQPLPSPPPLFLLPFLLLSPLSLPLSIAFSLPLSSLPPSLPPSLPLSPSVPLPLSSLSSFSLAPYKGFSSVAYRIVFSFDSDDIKAMSNENLDKSTSASSVTVSNRNRPISSTEILLSRQLSSDKERRYSAPPGERKNIRDSVGSLDYLSEGPGELGVCPPL